MSKRIGRRTKNYQKKEEIYTKKYISKKQKLVLRLERLARKMIKDFRIEKDEWFSLLFYFKHDYKGIIVDTINLSSDKIELKIDTKEGEDNDL